MFSNKRAVVTGGANGIGFAIARKLVQCGASVICADLAGGHLHSALARLQSLQSGRVAAWPVDVSRSDSVRNMFEFAAAEFGGLDILVNSAGICRVARVVDTPEEQWRKTIDVNLTGVFLCCQSAVPYMLEQKWGRIINISSQSGKRGGAGMAAYSASKFGVIGLTQSLARELAASGITVNAVCPGIIETEMWEALAEQYVGIKGASPEEVWRNVLAGIPVGRAGTAEEVADLVLFLASDRAAYMTGQAINITGGSQMD